MGIFLNGSTADRNREVGRKSQFREKIASLVLDVLSLSYLLDSSEEIMKAFQNTGLECLW